MDDYPQVYGARFGPGASGGAHADVIATASFDGTVKLWDTRAPGTNTAGNASNGSFACVSTLAGHADDVVGVDFRPGGTYVASGSGAFYTIFSPISQFQRLIASPFN